MASVGSFSSTTDFGFKDVKSEEKENLVRGVFSNVAHNYDVMNDLMSMGAHRLWKDELIAMIGYQAAAEAALSTSSAPSCLPRHLDVAGGTGDIAFRSIKAMEKAYGASFYILGEEARRGENEESQLESLPDSDRQVVICDINSEMLSVGASRVKEAVGNLAHHVGFVEGNAEKLPFPDNSFDIYTIAFGLRNVTNKEVALREAYRVLRRGGRLIVLEFSRLSSPALQQAYDAYSFNVIPKIGQIVANDADSYQYLVESIRRFLPRRSFRLWSRKRGFATAVTLT